MTDRTPAQADSAAGTQPGNAAGNEAGLRANDPVDRIDLPPEAVATDQGPDAAAASPTPPTTRSEGAEMAPEIDDIDGGETA